jgi:lipopolysaccharide/colanic/teichoic acid biosynthesis glycosyltransferase
MGNSDLRVSHLRNHEEPPGHGRKTLAHASRVPTGGHAVLKEETFHAMLTLERRRADRSRKPFVLMLLDSRLIRDGGFHAGIVETLASAVGEATRETDLVGWHEQGKVLAIIFTELNLEGTSPITEVLHSKMLKALEHRFDHRLVSKIVITAHVFPESWDVGDPERVADVKLYPDLSEKTSRKRLPTTVKRGMDILGSGMLLLILCPLLALIALAIKLSSQGPVIFEQERLGQFGRRFKCLKFRTMYANNDPKIHREYVQSFIAGKAEKRETSDTEPVVYKIKNDPRVTPIGKFLRKTSLDEFPQFWNVLRGDMSLVGPRPPVPYEFEVYDFWHRRRVLEVRPGVTGLWQVSGRSRTCFDDMVRLDLRYSQRWSLWLDLKILLATPRAVFTADGAL